MESIDISRRILKESFDILGRNEDTTAARVWQKDDYNEESQNFKISKSAMNLKLASLIKLVQNPKLL